MKLHRRNLKHRLTEANLLLDAFAFTGPTAVVSHVLETTGKLSKALDRVDRLALLGDILGGENEAIDRFRMVLGGEPAQNGNAIELARREVEVTTNYHPVRMRTFRQTVESEPSPIDVDAGDLLDGTLAVERALRRHSEKSPSDGVLIRRATRTVIDTDGSAWTEASPSVGRISLVGLSTAPTTLFNLFSAVTAQCDVEAHISQADMTKGLGLGPGDDNDPSRPKKDPPNTLWTDDANILDVLVDNPRTDDTALSEIMIHSDDYEHLNFDLVPSHKDMGLARDWMDDAGARLSLKVALEELVDDGYDFILIDCPPDLSV